MTFVWHNINAYFFEHAWFCIIQCNLSPHHQNFNYI
jgi:hypothetical protein